MSRSSCRTDFGLSSSPMRSEFRRNLSRSCKHTGCFPVYGTDSIRLTAARSCPVCGWVCVAAAAPDLVVHSLTALAFAKGYQATPSVEAFRPPR